MLGTVSLVELSGTTEVRTEVKNNNDCWGELRNNLNEVTVYEGRPVVKLPEIMPLNNSLNADIKRSHDMHCATTKQLPDNDGQ